MILPLLSWTMTMVYLSITYISNQNDFNILTLNNYNAKNKRKTLLPKHFQEQSKIYFLNYPKVDNIHSA